MCNLWVMNYAHPSKGWEVGNGPSPAVPFTFTHSPCFSLMLLPVAACRLPRQGTLPCAQLSSLQGLGPLLALVQGRLSAGEGHVSAGGLICVPEDVFETCSCRSLLSTWAF